MDERGTQKLADAGKAGFNDNTKVINYSNLEPLVKQAEESLKHFRAVVAEIIEKPKHYIKGGLRRANELEESGTQKLANTGRNLVYNGLRVISAVDKVSRGIVKNIRSHNK